MEGTHTGFLWFGLTVCPVRRDVRLWKVKNLVFVGEWNHDLLSRQLYLREVKTVCHIVCNKLEPIVGYRVVSANRECLS